MPQSTELIKTLKRALRSAHITYADIAVHLGMSEANVKRLFATQSFSLQRLEAICEMISMELSDLFALHDAARERIRHLTRQQEQELVGDIRLLLVAVSVRNQMSFEEIVERYRLTEAETIRYLARLDRLGIIDLLPGNRIKLLIDEHFEWLRNGPIERFYEQQIQVQFLRARFDAEVELRQFQFGLLGESASRSMIKKLRDLAREFTELHRADTKLPLNQRYSMGLLIAMRPWELGVFKPLMQEESSTLNEESSD